MARKEILERKNEIEEWVQEGKTIQEIAILLDCSVTTVNNYAKKMNIVLNKRENIQTKKIENQIFEISQLKVLERDFNPPFKSHETAYRCQCLKCGEIKTYRKSNIIKGTGCHNCSNIKGGRGYKEWNIGDKFGFLEIIEKGEKNGYVKCRCICGNIKEIRLQHLKGQNHGRTISCGCKQQSSGESKIEQILKENQIEYKTQYKIKEFSEHSLFDFAIFKNGILIKLIEFDGEQHYKPIAYFGGEEKFKIQQERDKRKNQYCKENNINLLRIPYWDYDKINLEYLFPKAEK